MHMLYISTFYALIVEHNSDPALIKSFNRINKRNINFI